MSGIFYDRCPDCGVPPEEGATIGRHEPEECIANLREMLEKLTERVATLEARAVSGSDEAANARGATK